MPKLRMLLLTFAVSLLPITLFSQEEKPKSNNEEGSVAVETDSGRYGVGSDKLDPRQLGVAIYPGAKILKSENNGKGANLSLDWGQESVRLYVQKYVTSDSADRVLAFYRKQLSKFGAVLECRDGKPVSAVASKLKCDNDKDEKSTELKAGTEEKQHIVGVTSKDGRTEFGIVYLDPNQARGTVML